MFTAGVLQASKVAVLKSGFLSKAPKLNVPGIKLGCEPRGYKLANSGADR